MISNRLNNNPKIKKKHFINNSKKYITPSNKKTLIENISKLNLQDILKKSKCNTKIRNNKIIIDKSLFYSSDNNNQNITYNDFENEDKKFDTDNNLSINCHNNIFDFYDIDKFDTNNSTIIESKNISSNSNNIINKKHMINKTIRKKRIINLKSFLIKNVIKTNNQYSIEYFLKKLNNIIKRHFIKILLAQMNKLQNLHSSSKKINKSDTIKLKNLEEKNIQSGTKNNQIINEVIGTNLITKEISSNNNEAYNIINCFNINNSNSFSSRNCLNYIEQLSSRYNKDREESILHLFKYKPTNISFLLNNFENNNIFKNIQKEFNLVKEELKLNENMRNHKQINLFKKYYGDIEAINEEENESEELRNGISSQRNKDNSLNRSCGEMNQSVSFYIEDNNDFSINKMLYKMKLNNKILIKKCKSKRYIIKPAMRDNYKIDINCPINLFHKLDKIYKIQNKFEIDQSSIKYYKNNSHEDLGQNNINSNVSKKNTILNQNFIKSFSINEEQDKIREKIINEKKINYSKNNQVEKNLIFKILLKKFILSIILLFLFIVIFISKNLLIEQK